MVELNAKLLWSFSIVCYYTSIVVILSVAMNTVAMRVCRHVARLLERGVTNMCV